MENQHNNWQPYERVLFRFAFIFLTIQLLPVDNSFFKAVESIFKGNWGYNEFFVLANYSPSFFSESQGLYDWILIFTISLIGAIIWQIKDKKTKAYPDLYYWIRVAVRYKLALAAITYGLIKIFPLQGPFPSLSILNTPYGEMAHWKLFMVSLGAAPGYVVFLGLVEAFAGILLLFRKCASIGALLLFFFTGNVFFVNLAYEGGEAFYSLYLNILSFFVFAYDARRFYSLFILRQQTQPNRYKPLFSKKSERLRVALKSFSFFFITVYVFQVHIGFIEGSYKYSSEELLPELAGYYNVEHFLINGLEIPHSRTHPVRWQNVVFEKWNTISIRDNNLEKPFSVGTEKEALAGRGLYEASGNIGRHYYHYNVHNNQKLLTLKNINPHYENDILTLAIEYQDQGKINLKGYNSAGDSLSVQLQKIDKEYLLILGRKKEPLQL